MLHLLRGKWAVAAASMTAVAALLAFTLASPSTTIGQETDLPTAEDPAAQPPASDPDADTGAGSASPPASLPDTGNGGYLESLGSSKTLMLGLLAGVGVMLVGAGAAAARQARRVEGD